jgi:hypothetical protein
MTRRIGDDAAPGKPNPIALRTAKTHPTSRRSDGLPAGFCRLEFPGE